MLGCNSAIQDHMAVKKKEWTAEENERLKAFAAKGASIIKVAAALKRTTSSVRVQARKLGTPFPTMAEYRKQFRGGTDNPWREY